MTLGEKIKQLRKEKNISQEQLSNYLGINRNFLSRIETNKSEPNASILKKICFLFNTNLNYLLDIFYEKNNTNEKINYIYNNCYSLSEEDLDFLIRIVTIMKNELNKNNIIINNK